MRKRVSQPPLHRSSRSCPSASSAWSNPKRSLAYETGREPSLGGVHWLGARARIPDPGAVFNAPFHPAGPAAALGARRNLRLSARAYLLPQLSALKLGPWLLGLSTIPETDVLYTR
jgi:hypothetical protein